MMKKVKLSTWAKDNDMKYLAAWKMAKAGLIPTENLPTGAIRVLIEELEKPKEEKIAIYCRVSSSAQRDTTLQTQKDRLINYCMAKGYQVSKVVLETGSGLNDTRKHWISLLTDTSITRIVIEHRDRFTRFGFNAFVELLKTQGRVIEVVNDTEDDKQDLMSDFVSIVTSYCSRIYGSKRSQRKKEAILAEIKDTN